MGHESAKRDERLASIRNKSRAAEHLSTQIQCLENTIRRVEQGEGFFKVMSKQHGVGWESFPGIDDSADEHEIRQFVIQYAKEKQRLAEQKFDAL